MGNNSDTLRGVIGRNGLPDLNLKAVFCYWTSKVLVTRGAELSTDHHLVVSWILLAEEEVGQTWQTQTYCEGLLGTSGRALCQGEVFNSHLRKSFSQIPREAGRH
ncbi:hypothetical protein L3Q82_016304 [Scortum barcoo]|uniref:Uncharacterized protein n=1 Tax=Scortum barcoo TaxID=214431 RepID=A0ACB8VQV4_9TELE|nr:hypothetical protein L3Q82_016304 [Scortum barcoo]